MTFFIVAYWNRENKTPRNTVLPKSQELINSNQEPLLQQGISLEGPRQNFETNFEISQSQGRDLNNEIV